MSEGGLSEVARLRYALQDAVRSFGMYHEHNLYRYVNGERGSLPVRIPCAKCETEAEVKAALGEQP